VLILMEIIGAPLWLVRKNNVYSDDVAQIRRVRSAAADLLSTLQDAETCPRCFLLTSANSVCSSLSFRFRNRLAKRKASSRSTLAFDVL
jgi:CHASE3 domain sensor protein